MKLKEIQQLFNYIYGEFLTIKPEDQDYKDGYFKAILEIFAELTQYTEE